MITTYKLFEKSIHNKNLFHGSLDVFFEFKDSMSFFSETRKFAEDYASTKSFDYALDKEPIVYTVKFKGNIFDINDKECYKELENNLPDSIEYSSNNFGFTEKMEKDAMLFQMTGYYIKEPEPSIKNVSVGDVFKIPISMSQNDNYKVVKIDDTYVYAYNLRWDYVRTIFDDNYDYNAHKYFREFKKKLKEYIAGGDLVGSGKYVSDGEQKLYYFAFLNDGSMYNVDIDKKSMKKLQFIYDKCYKEYDKYLVEKYTKKFIRQDTKIKIGDTWRLYENDTVYNSIKKLGYDGYIALEDGENTWAIYNPLKTIKIINVSLPFGDFSDLQDLKKFRKFEKEKTKEYKKTYGDTWYNKIRSYDIYIGNLEKMTNLN